jgi:hypothetical protein
MRDGDQDITQIALTFPQQYRLRRFLCIACVLQRSIDMALCFLPTLPQERYPCWLQRHKRIRCWSSIRAAYERRRLPDDLLIRSSSPLDRSGGGSSVGGADVPLYIHARCTITGRAARHAGTWPLSGPRRFDVDAGGYGRGSWPTRSRSQRQRAHPRPSRDRSRRLW